MRDMSVTLSEEEEKEFSDENPFIVPGYVGKPKGSRVHTFLRGRWRAGMTHKQCCIILNAMPDFKMETSRLQKWWIEKGHGSVKTITSTPESVEVEYDWGKSKYEFRNHINTKSTSVPIYRASVMKSLGRHSYISRTGEIITHVFSCVCAYSLSHVCVCITGQLRPPPLPRRRHWRFIRRANDYLRAYSLYDTPRSLEKASAHDDVTLFSLIEKTRRAYKSHRCAGEQEFSFTVNDDERDQIAPEDDVNCERYLINPRPLITIDEQVDRYLQSLS